jgi:L-histidine N-alpha-methyltransferase
MDYSKEAILINTQKKLVNHLPRIGADKVKDEILAGLRDFPKYISPKFFYNEEGSELFEQITKLEEYYPTRIEKKLISTISDNIPLDFYNLNIIELGSGDSSKISLLLNQIPEYVLPTITYFPVDISQSAIEKSEKLIAEKFSTIHIHGIVADFIHQLNLIPKTEKRLFCFFGSTIGNLTIDEVKKFMTALGSEMQKGDGLLLGLDMIKDIAVLERAYNDSEQVTANFNKNILNVVNNLTGSNFNTREFEHLAFYNQEKRRIEMHLKAKTDMVITFNSDTEAIFIKKGECIHTENSHKFNIDSIENISVWADFHTEIIVVDKNEWFCLVYYKKNK